MIKNASNLGKNGVHHREPEPEPHQRDLFSESRVDLTSNISALEREYRQDLMLVLQKMEAPKIHHYHLRLPGPSLFSLK